MEISFQEKLADLLRKDISSLTASDILFIRARQSYLTEEQLKIYGPMISNKAPIKLKEDKLAHYRELKKQATEKGIVVPKGTKIEELELMLS